MKRRKEYLVEKRDGRREFLRATKLARSIHRALVEVGVDEDWRAIEIANVVLAGLRERRVAAACAADGANAAAHESDRGVMLTTCEIADAVQHLLVVTGMPAAAAAYGVVAAERARRRQSLAQWARTSGPRDFAAAFGDAFAGTGDPLGGAAGAAGAAGARSFDGRSPGRG